MKINAVTETIILILFLANMSSVTFNLAIVTDDLSIINVPDNYPTIQEAVDAASPGDTVMVASGTYYEHMTISKNDLTLLGENPSTTTIDGNGTGPIIYLSANNTTIMGFTIRNSGEEQGLFLKYADCNTIMSNIYNDCHIGIKIQGNMTHHSWGNKIVGNTLINNFLGINLVLFSVCNIINWNSVASNNVGIDLRAYSSNNTINGNTVTNNNYGVYLSHSKGNVITGNVITQHDRGIELYGSLSTCNTISCNTIANNKEGIHVYQSNDNIAYHNNFIENINQVYFDSLSFHMWDNGEEGNYWSDYEGEDLNKDDLGDTPYIIDETNQDNHPFISLWGWDTTNPSVTIISPTNGSEITSSTVGATWIGSDDISGMDHYEIQLDDSSWINVGMTTTYTFTEVRDGSHIIKAKAVDNAGNSNMASLSFTVNTGRIGGPMYVKEVILLALGAVAIVGIAIYFLKIKKKA